MIVLCLKEFFMTRQLSQHSFLKWWVVCITCQALFGIWLRNLSTFQKSSYRTSTFRDSDVLPPGPPRTLLVALMLTFHPAQALLIQMSFNLQLALRYDPVNPFKVPIQFWLTFSARLSSNNLIALSHIRYFITSISFFFRSLCSFMCLRMLWDSVRLVLHNSSEVSI